MVGVMIGGCTPNVGLDKGHNVHDLQHGYLSTIDSADMVEPKALPNNPRAATKEVSEMLQLLKGQETTIPDLPLEFRSNQRDIAGAGNTCDIRFMDEVALLILPDHAANTFALSPFYIEGCGKGWLHLIENSNRYQDFYRSNYQHYHLGWNGFCYNFGTGKPGVQTGGSCIEIDPKKQDRFVNPHTNKEWLRAYVYKSGDPELPFDLLRMRVRNRGIRMWVRKSAGNWLHYVISVGYWTITQADDIREILISGQPGAPIGDIWEIDDLRIRVP